MGTVNINEAKSTHSKLIERAAAGEDVILARAGTPVARRRRAAFLPYPLSLRSSSKSFCCFSTYFP